MADDSAVLRLRAVVELAQAMAVALHDPARGRRAQAALRAWRRDGRLVRRGLGVGAGDAAGCGCWSTSASSSTGEERSTRRTSRTRCTTSPRSPSSCTSAGRAAAGAAGLGGDGSRPRPADRPVPGARARAAAEGRAAGAGAADDAAAQRRVAALLRRGRGSCVVAPVVLHGRAWGELYVARRGRARPPSTVTTPTSRPCWPR